MQTKVDMKRVNRNDSIKAYGSISFGEITIRNVVLTQNSEGELFLSMPSRYTGKVVDGKKQYEDIAHPITKELRQSLTDAAIESYNKGHPVILTDDKQGKMRIHVEVFEAPFYNKVGRCELVINEMFAINDVFINTNKGGGLYVTLPNIRKKTDNNGKAIYSEIIIMNNPLKQAVKEAVIGDYLKEKECREQNRISIIGRLSNANELVSRQETKVSPAKQIEH